jgi:hypothetical protein
LADILSQDAPSAYINKYLQSAANEIRDLISYVEQHRIPCLADITNRLFPALPLPDEVEKRDLEELTKSYDNLLSRVEALNSRMVVASFRHLDKVAQGGHVLLIGGGKFKLEALWTVLICQLVNPSIRFVTEVCSDYDLALKLMAARQKFDAAETRIQQWYTRMADRLFRDGIAQQQYASESMDGHLKPKRKALGRR